MKRSEMIKIMQDACIKYTEFHKPGITRMSLILDDMEKAGMLPPKAQVMERSALYDDDGELMFDQMISISAHTWEPEE
jgi:hypothetical protein